MSVAGDGRPSLAEELRRRRTALGWTLEQVAEQAQVSVGMLSLIETGKRRPSLRSWERIRSALGITDALPVEVLHQPRPEITDGLVACLGACLAAVRQATLAELAEATGWPVSEVRLALRRLAEQLEATGMKVLDDGSHVQLTPGRRYHGTVARLAKPEQLPRLTQEQAEVLAIVIADGMTTRRRIEEGRGATQLSIGPGGPISLPRDSSETLALCSPEASWRRIATIMRWGGRWSTGPLHGCCSCSGRRPSKRREGSSPRRTSALTRRGRWLGWLVFVLLRRTATTPTGGEAYPA
jgi:transcriptional regulator with XRE-family HTH domain